MVAQNIAFGILAAAIAFSAIRVVTTDNLVHAALYLVGVLAGAAGLYLLLAAEFLAVVQIIVYVGAIVVLFLFGIMLTKAQIGKAAHLTGTTWPIALGIALILAGLLGYVLTKAFGNQKVSENRVIGSTAMVSDSIFGQYLIPFEVVSVLLLAALIGAIVLAKKD
jgi:NADH-quinone oxidoreductase subunit J